MSKKRSSLTNNIKKVHMSRLRVTGINGYSDPLLNLRDEPSITVDIDEAFSYKAVDLSLNKRYLG